MAAADFPVIVKHWGAKTRRPFSSSLVISFGQRAAGGGDVLRKLSHVTSLTAAGEHTLLEDLSLLSASRIKLHKKLFIWVSQLHGERAHKLRESAAFCYFGDQSEGG